MSNTPRDATCRIDGQRSAMLDAPARARVCLATDGAELRTSGHWTGVTAWLVLRGVAVVQAREGEFHLRAGDWLLLEGDAGPCARVGPRGIVVAVQLARDDTGPSAADEGEDALFSGCGSLPAGTRRQALRLWKSRDEPGLQGRAAALLACVQAPQAEVVRRCPGRSPGRRRRIFARLQRARLYMQGHAGMCARIGELARWSHFSPWYFSKLFQAVYGLAPQQYAARLRLEQARRLLLESRMPVTDVSLASGFDSPCSFARAFRAQFGASASEYRLLHARPVVPPRHAPTRIAPLRAGARA